MGTVAAATAYADKPAPVTVTNTPLPVTITNPTTGGGANVTVTNPATNPVKTSIDQYPRTPVTAILTSDQFSTQTNSYKVLDGSRFIIETVTLISKCNNLPTFTHGSLQINNGNDGGVFIPLQLTGTFAGNEYSATVNVRVVAPPAAAVRVDGVGCGVNEGPFTFANVFGYLVSVNSPSLAP